MDSQLPLMTKPLDTATPLRQRQQDDQRAALNHEQVLGQYYQNLDTREKSRLSSVISGAVQLEQFINADDLEGAHNFLMNRRNAVQNRIAQGENLDTEDTDAALDMIRKGNIDELRNNIQGLKAAGQVYGVIGKSDMPANVKEWQAYNQLSPEDQERYLTMKRSNQVVNLGDQQIVPSQVNPAGPAQASYGVGLKPADQPDNVRAKEVAAGEGRNAADKQAMFGKAQNALVSLKSQAAVVTNTIDEAIGLVSPFSTGYGVILSNLPNTDARALSNALDTIKANVGFDKLQEMRDNSPTGGALGQVSEMENRLLQAVNGALDPMQADQLVRNLQTIKEIYPRLLAQKEGEFQQDYGDRLSQGNQQQQIGQQLTQGQRVKIRDPKTGKTGTVSAEQAQAAIQQGYEVIQ